MTSTIISDNKKEKKNNILKEISVKHTISFNGKILQQYIKYYDNIDYWSFLEIVA